MKWRRNEMAASRATQRDLSKIPKVLRESLREEGIRVSPQRLSRYLKELGGTRRIFPLSRERAMFVGLMEKWRRMKDGKTVVRISQMGKKEKFPTTVSFGVLGSDWPGLSESCIGVLHQKGYNIAFAKGMVVEHGGQQLGVVIMAVEVTSQQELDRLAADKEYLAETLSKASIGSLAKAYLIAREGRRLETYSRVIEAIEKQCPQEELEDLLGRRGEAVMFFASRPEEYVYERKVEDLVDQIIVNSRFLKKVRETGGRPQVWIKNIKTRREHLTGVTVAGYDRELSLNDCLEAIEHAVPDFKRKFNKEFTTPDGITVYRLEICNGKGQPYSRNEIRHIRKALLQMATSKKFQRARWTDSPGGFEHYIRAIIPLLLREYRTSGIPQVYLSIAKATDFYLEFKIIIILSGSRAEQEKQIFSLVDALESVPGMSVLSSKPPRMMGSEGFNVIDLQVDLDRFRDRRSVYQAIKGQLSGKIGQFRDFDEGMRILETQKLAQVRGHFKSRSEGLVREFYYGLEDFYRVSATAEELVELIRMGMKVQRNLAGSGKSFIVESKNVSVGPAHDTRPITLIGIASDPRTPSFKGCLGPLSDYEVTVSRVQREEVTVLLLRVAKNGHALDGKSLNRLHRELRESLTSCTMSD
jgi:hypothetical protein